MGATCVSSPTRLARDGHMAMVVGVPRAAKLQQAGAFQSMLLPCLHPCIFINNLALKPSREPGVSGNFWGSHKSWHPHFSRFLAKLREDLSSPLTLDPHSFIQQIFTGRSLQPRSNRSAGSRPYFPPRTEPVGAPAPQIHACVCCPAHTPAETADSQAEGVQCCGRGRII